MISSQEIEKKVRRMELLAQSRLQESLMGAYTSSFKGSGIEFEEVRAYYPGDDTRLIDWNVTARKQETHIKKFREEREVPIFLMIDVSASMDVTTSSHTKREQATQIAALLAHLALKNHDQVSLLLFSDRVNLYWPSAKGRNQISKILHEILVFPSQPVRSQVQPALQFASNVWKKKGLVFIISDFLFSVPDGLLALISRKHEVVSIWMKDSLDSKVPEVGLLRCFDPESKNSTIWDTSNLTKQKRYAQLSSDHKSQVLSIFKKHKCRGFSVSTLESAIDKCVSYFTGKNAGKYHLWLVFFMLMGWHSSFSKALGQNVENAQDIIDIKPLAHTGYPVEILLIFTLLGGGIGVVFFLLYRRYRKALSQKKALGQFHLRESPFQRAQNALNTLPAEESQFDPRLASEMVLKVTSILKEFLEQLWKLNATDQTTQDLVVLFKNWNLDQKVVDSSLELELKQLLETSDVIKFNGKIYSFLEFMQIKTGASRLITEFFEANQRKLGRS
jgi:Mg-chelatase subunit ChlD